MSVSNKLDLHKFTSIIDEYSSFYQNPPKTAYQLTQFCNKQEHSYKYGELSRFFLVWQKQKRTTTTAGPDSTRSESECTPDINWDSFWKQYETQYKYPPKKAVHLWNFAKDEKMMIVKYKEARSAFDRISKQFKNETAEDHQEGYQTRSATDSGLKSSKLTLKLKINKYTKSEDIERIRVSFLECLEAFRSDILHDPVSALQLFNFINGETKYSARYGDVKSAYRFAMKHKWFKPKKRMKKVHQRTTDAEAEGSEEGEEGQSEYILEVDYDAIPKEEEKKEVIVKDIMDDDEFEAILVKYRSEYHNPPRTASQIMNFAKDIGEIFKYKACRVAFHRWQHMRAGDMPKISDIEPGNNDRE